MHRRARGRALNRALHDASGRRAGLALLAALNLVAATALAHHFAHGGGVPFDRADPFAALASGAPGLVVVAAGLVAIYAFARTGQLRFAVGALVADAVLQEGLGRILGVYFEPFVMSGGALVGWVLGAGLGRALRRPEGEAALGVAGATAALGALYCNAALSKLATSGLAWAWDPGTIRLMILAHHPVGAGALGDRIIGLVTSSATASRLFAVGTLLAELGGALFAVSRRARPFAATALLAFHGALYALTGILFPTGAVLLLLFGYDWPPPSALATPRRRALMGAAALALTACAALALARVRDVKDLPGPMFLASVAALAAGWLAWSRGEGAVGPARGLVRRKDALRLAAALAVALALLWLLPFEAREHPSDRGAESGSRAR